MEYTEFLNKIISLENIKVVEYQDLYPGAQLTIIYNDNTKYRWEANIYNDPQRELEKRIHEFYIKLIEHLNIIDLFN